MAASKWFDYNGYMANKLVQVQKAEPDAAWNMTKLVNTFADNGFAGAEGAEKHFEAYGQYEEVAPNAFFNATEYYRAKAAEFYDIKDPKAVTDLDVANIKLAFQNAGLSAWSHYEQYGNSEGVNPSNSFDTTAYMTAKLDAMKATADGKDMTMAQLNAAFKVAGLSALEHFMIYGGAGAGEVTMKYDGTIPTEFAVPEDKKVNDGGGSGERFTLTSAIDTIVGTAGDDTIIGDNSGGVNTIQGGDSIDGGSGEDTLTLYSNGGILPNFKNIEMLELHGVGANDVNIASKVGVQHLLVDGIDATASQTIKSAAGVSFTLENVVDNTNTLVFDTPDAAVNLTLGDVTATGAGLDFGTATNKANTTLNITAVGKNNVELVNSGGSLTTVNVAGDGKLTFEAPASVTTVNAAENAGGVTFSAVSNTLKFTGGKGDDTLVFATAAHFDAADIIDMGAGTGDTIKLNLATIDAPTAGLLKKVVGLDVLDLNGGAGGSGYSVAASDFATFHTFKFSKAATGAVGTSGATAVDGAAGASVTGLASDGTDTIILDAAAFTGGAGVTDSTDPAHAGAGVQLVLKSVEAHNAVNLVIGETGVATVTLTGGAGATNANGGVGLDASNIDELHINLLSDLTVTSGTDGATATEADTLVAAKASIFLAGKGDANLGVVSDTAAALASAALKIDASGLNGKLTVTTGDGNDIILAGSKGSDITGGKGADTITLGDGADRVTFVGGDSGKSSGASIDGIDVINHFTAGVGGDVLRLDPSGANADKYTALSDVALAAVSGMTGLKAAADQALTLAAKTSDWTAFTHGGKTYAVYDTGTTFNASTGVIVELAGVDVHNLTDANFLA